MKQTVKVKPTEFWEIKAQDIVNNRLRDLGKVVGHTLGPLCAYILQVQIPTVLLYFQARTSNPQFNAIVGASHGNFPHVKNFGNQVTLCWPLNNIT
jgi:hypothetical protein